MHNIYMVFVGGTDILGWTNHGTETDVYITGLSLTLTDIKIKSPVYYISMKAENGAGQESSVITSTPIVVVDEDKPGKISIVIVSPC